ncbi:uncharacterized protein LOC108092599 [Drosophila ficusphila]|uniref:uncharacterized protein LOC108092599 n=1 Tax=Drosophila ficusphila TaxID=30025 RepID=UPI0007E70760|nr:uncharacterized protein LOC108092599 [Drosophila ficusphila]
MKAAYFICGLFVLLNLASSDERNFRFYFADFAVTYRVTDIFEKVPECHLDQLNNRSYVNIEMRLNRNVADVGVRAVMDFWKPNTQKKMRLYDIRVDACALLKTFHKNKLLNTYVKSLKKHTNVNLMCPFKANFTYKLVDWFLDEQDFPPYVPLGKFRTNTEYFTQERLVTRIVAHGEILSKK